MQVQKTSESKLLERKYVEMVFEDMAGKLSRKDAVAAAAGELGVGADQVGLLGLEQQSGTRKTVGRFNVYDSPQAKARLHPRYLDERSLTKEEREKLKQERKKKASPAPAAEAKK